MKKIITLSMLIMLLLPWVIGLSFFYMKSQSKLICHLSGSVAFLYRNGGVHYSDGDFLLNTSLNGNGSGHYSGDIIYIDKINTKKDVIPVNISFTYTFKTERDGLAKGKITSISEEIGNMASHSQIARFMGPGFISDKFHITKMYMLGGVTRAWGSTVSPGIVCTK